MIVALEINGVPIEPKLRKVWNGMQGRCRTRDARIRQYYRDRGVKILWKDFTHFYRDMAEGYAKHLIKNGEKQTTIDRINPEGHYCKDNCRWATYKVQYENTMHKKEVSRVMFSIDGVERTLDEWSKISGVKKKTIMIRYKKGWTEKASVFSPITNLGPDRQKPIFLTKN